MGTGPAAGRDGSEGQAHFPGGRNEALVCVFPGTQQPAQGFSRDTTLLLEVTWTGLERKCWPGLPSHHELLAGQVSKQLWHLFYDEMKQEVEERFLPGQVEGTPSLTQARSRSPRDVTNGFSRQAFGLCSQRSNSFQMASWRGCGAGSTCMQDQGPCGKVTESFGREHEGKPGDPPGAGPWATLVLHLGCQPP